MDEESSSDNSNLAEATQYSDDVESDSDFTEFTDSSSSEEDLQLGRYFNPAPEVGPSISRFTLHPGYPPINYGIADDRNTKMHDALMQFLQLDARNVFTDFPVQDRLATFGVQAHENVLLYNRTNYSVNKLPFFQAEYWRVLQHEFQNAEFFARRVALCTPVDKKELSYNMDSTTREQLSLQFRVSQDVLGDLRRQRQNSLALLYPADEIDEMSFRAMPVRPLNAIIVYVKAFLERSKPPRGSNFPIWPFPNETLPGLYERLSKVHAIAFAADCSATRAFIDKIRHTSGQQCGLVFVGHLGNYFREGRMLQITARPQDFQGDDYNVSPLYDIILNPQLCPRELPMQAFPFNLPAGDPGKLALYRKVDALLAMDRPSMLVIQGGPGTSKTTNIADVIIRRFNASRTVHGGQDLKILVAAPSNSAADCAFERIFEQAVLQRGYYNIVVRRLLADGVDIENRQARRYYEEGLEQHKQYCMVHRITNKTERMERYIADADILVVTLGNSQMRYLARQSRSSEFNLLIVDECGQASETQLLMPLCFTSLRYAILVGDSSQLGPTLLSPLTQRLPLRFTHAFHRIQEALQPNHQDLLFTLQPQHRMRQRVCHLVNRIGYGNRPLETDPAAGRRTRGNPPLMVFSGRSWMDRMQAVTNSMRNEREAAFGMHLLQASMQVNGYDLRAGVWRQGSTPLRYAIISLYQAQVQYYIELIKGIPNLGNSVLVSTVDSAQGCQFDIAIVSAVRASGVIGFAGQRSRLVVALSRAACVYILAHYPTFSPSDLWSPVFRFASQHGVFFPNADSFTPTNNDLNDLLETQGRPDRAGDIRGF